MATKKVSAADEQYIRDHAHDMSVRAIAEMIGCSKSTVQRLKRKLGCRMEDAAAMERAYADKDIPSDELAILRSLARRLWGEVKTSSGNVLARLSHELRETLERISDIEAEQVSDHIEAKAVSEEVSCVDAICSTISEPDQSP